MERQTMRTPARRGSGWVVLAALVAAGCFSKTDPMTKTEKLRQTLDPRVQQFLLAGEQAYKQGNYVAALALSDSAEVYAPDLADIHFFRGRIYTDLNQLDIAKAAYEATLDADPAYRGAHMNLGINSFRRGKLRDAINSFKQEEALEPNSGLYLEMGRVYAKLGEADSARLAYEQSIALDSTNTTALMWLGQLYEEMGDFEKALVYSRRGAALKPDNLDYRYIIGSQLFRVGQVEEAVAQLQPVAEQRPWHHGAQYNLGQALMRLGREDEAQHFLDRAEAAQQVQQEIQEAHDAINQDPNDLQNWIRLGEAHRKGQMYDRAADAFRRAVTIDPGNLYLQTNLATLLMESGDTTAAIQHYQAVLKADSTLADAWLNLGVAYGNTRRYEEARHAWQQVLRHRPGDRTARAFLAQLGELAQAQ
jgi:tetratricopeptide (TPR) repeat protein